MKNVPAICYLVSSWKYCQGNTVGLNCSEMAHAGTTDDHFHIIINYQIHSRRLTFENTRILPCCSVALLHLILGDFIESKKNQSDHRRCGNIHLKSIIEESMTETKWHVKIIMTSFLIVIYKLHCFFSFKVQSRI